MPFGSRGKIERWRTIPKCSLYGSSAVKTVGIADEVVPLTSADRRVAKYFRRRRYTIFPPSSIFSVFSVTGKLYARAPLIL